MKNKQENNDIFNIIDFNRNEIKTDENFFDEFNMKDNNEDISLDFNKSEDSLSSDKLDLCDKSMEEQMNKVTLNEEKNSKNVKKITKEDLKTIPIPIFECIFCADEDLSFRHYINEIMSMKYLYNVEKKDITLVEFLMDNNLLEMKENKNNIVNKFGIKNNINLFRINSLIKLLFDNTEYINKYYNIKESTLFLKQKRIREKKEKIKNEFSSNKNDNNDNNIQNDLINKIDFSQGKYGDNKINIFEDEKEKENENGKNKKEDLIDDEGFGFVRLFDENCFVDLSRKIKKEDIIFEKTPYNIWENNIDDSFENDS